MDFLIQNSSFSHRRHDLYVAGIQIARITDMDVPNMRIQFTIFPYMTLSQSLVHSGWVQNLKTCASGRNKWLEDCDLLDRLISIHATIIVEDTKNSIYANNTHLLQHLIHDIWR